MTCIRATRHADDRHREAALRKLAADAAAELGGDRERIAAELAGLYLSTAKFLASTMPVEEAWAQHAGLRLLVEAAVELVATAAASGVPQAVRAALADADRMLTEAEKRLAAQVEQRHEQAWLRARWQLRALADLARGGRRAGAPCTDQAGRYRPEEAKG